MTNDVMRETTHGGKKAKVQRQKAKVKNCTPSSRLPFYFCLLPSFAGDREAAVPLDLRLLPAGCRLLINVRPAVLLSTPAGRDLVRALDKRGSSALEVLEKLTRFPPAEIDHVLVGLVPSAGREPPQMAAVVTLARDLPLAELLAALGNPEPARSGSDQYYVSRQGPTAYYAADARTFAVLPRRFADEVVADPSTALPTSPEIEALVDETDSRRLFTVLFETRFLREEILPLLPSDDQRLVGDALDLLSDDVEAGVLSVDAGDVLSTQLVVRSSTDLPARRLEARLEQRLRHLPYDVLDYVKTTDPRRGRRLVGRFPAMIKALALSLQFESTGRHVRVTSVLPERAGPNLLLAGSLTADLYTAAHPELR